MSTLSNLTILAAPSVTPHKHDNETDNNSTESDNLNDQSGEAVNAELESLEETEENNLATHPEDLDNEVASNSLPEEEQY